MKLTNNNQGDFDINKIKVPRTREGFIMEAVAAMLLIGAWVVALARHEFASAFYGEWYAILIGVTILVVALLVSAYFPKFINHSRQFSNVRQVMLNVRMTRVLAIELALMLFVDKLMDGKLLSHTLLPIIPASVMVITALVFLYLIRRAK
jgi:hypothetical protein